MNRLNLILFLFFPFVSARLWNETFPKGEEIRVSNLELYSVGSSNEFSVIVFHDIRGYKVAQTRVFCDRLAAEFQSHVVLPDFFHGETAPLDHLLFGNWLSINGIWSNVSRDLNIVSSWLKQSNPKKNISLIGFCWGGLQVVRSVSKFPDAFICGVSIHGSSITADEVRQIQRPVGFIAAGNDPALVPNISSVIEENNPNVARRSFYRTFPTMKHGFAAAGANFSDPNNVLAIDEVHQEIRSFFNSILGRNFSNKIELETSAICFLFLLKFYSIFLIEKPFLIE